MKRTILTITFSLIAFALMAQVPAGFSYQAVVRNSSGEIVANQTVKFRISILQNSGIGTAVYVETHSVPTGNFGLANFVVGLGNRVSGSLDLAGWGNNPHFLKIELDPDNGNSFSHLGTLQLMAVPYAFHAQTVEIDEVDDADHDPTNEIQVLDISGLALSLSRGGGTITLPTAEGDNWGTEFVHTDATLSGQGTTTSPLNIAQQSAATGQVLKWNGTSWVPATDEIEDADHDPTNELQDLSIVGNQLQLSKSSEVVDLSPYLDNTDSQTLSISENSLTISGGNTVTLPASDGGDDWGADYVHTNATLDGQGTTGSPLKIAQQLATTGQVLKWNGSIWTPGNDATGGEFALPIDKTSNTAGAAFKISNVNWDSYSGAIYGHSGSTTGYGVYGSSFMTGVMGEAMGGTSYNYGVLGLSHSSEGTGVHGFNDNVSGKTSGVYGSASSTSGTGVYGDAFALSGTTYGVQGRSFSPSGTGVYGIAEGTTGTGVLGKGKTYGVKGESTSGYGVYGHTTFYSGWGVYGFADNTGDEGNVGVYGKTNSTAGTGVIGYASAETGSSKGVIGQTEAPQGYGVAGYHTAGTGTGIGVNGYTSSSTGFSGHFTGGKFYVGGKVGLGTTTPSQQLSIGNNLDLYSGNVNSPQKPSIRGGGDHLFINSYGSSGILVFNYDEGSGETWFNKGTRNLLMITKEGRIGMGNTSPQARLHVTGTGFPDSFIYIQSNNGQDAGIRLYEGNNVKWHIFNDPAVAGLQIYNTTGNNAIFAKQSNAYVGLGTTSPIQKLHVVGQAYKTEGGTAWATSSDLRLKTVLGGYAKGLDEIAALKAVRFVYNANNPRQLAAGVEQVGFVAQEVQKIFPEAVSEAEDGYLDLNIHAVNVALINAVKELKAENDKLKSEMVQMKTEYEARLSKVEYLISANAAK